jgi:penicillin amidase
MVMERDGWGTPTVWVHDDLAAAMATGWLHASDRLIQTLIAVVVGQGRLLEVIGDKPFARRADRATRQLRMEEGLDEAVAAMPADLRAWMDAYCAGFDAGARARGAPLVLRALGIRVPTWTPRLVLLVQRVLSWFGLSSTSQLAKATLGQLIAGGASDRALHALLGAEAAQLDPGLLRGIRWPAEDALLAVAPPAGSNAFAIAGSRTRSGGAIVLAEFHLEVGRLPPVLYPIDLRYADGRTELGMTIPGVPHLLAGRNRRVAWSYTFGHADAFDLTVERCGNGGVHVGDTFEPWVRREHRISPRGKRPESWVMYELPGHRALLGHPAPGGPAIGMAWRGFAEPLADHLVLWRARRADSVAELVALHRTTRTLSTAGVFGDAAGHIAWMHNGVIAAERRGPGPRTRSAADPDLPESARPVRIDPPEGFVSSANEACPGWTSFPEPRYRKQRLDELLSMPGTWDLDRAWGVTYDPVDRCASRLAPVWAGLVPEDPALQRIGAWAAAQTDDEPGRAALARFHLLHEELSRALLTTLLGPAEADAIVDQLGLLMAFQDALDDLLALDRPDLLSADALRALLNTTLPRLDAASSGPAIGVDRFKDLLFGMDAARFAGMHSRPLRFPGGPTSLFQSRRVRLLGEQLLGGPAFHLLMDLGGAGARYNVAGGASERRWGPGYGAGLDAWAGGGWKPLGPHDPGAPR